MSLDRPIFVTGAARSRTSMVAGILHVCGAWGGDMSGPTRSNRRGMFENREVRNNIVKPWLLARRLDPMGQDPLPDIDKMKAEAQGGEPEILAERFTGTMVRQGYDGKAPLFYKGAKMCLMWPLWHAALPHAQWIIVRRPDHEIVNSCMRTGFMRAYKNKAGWHYWLEQHKKRFAEMLAEPGLDAVELWSSEIVEGDLSALRAAIEHVGLPWRKQAIKEFIDPSITLTGGMEEA